MGDIERIAMCTNPHGLHEHVPLKPDEPMPTTCFADCDCTPVEFVRADTERARVAAYVRGRASDDWDPSVEAALRRVAHEIERDYHHGGR